MRCLFSLLTSHRYPRHFYNYKPRMYSSRCYQDNLHYHPKTRETLATKKSEQKNRNTMSKARGQRFHDAEKTWINANRAYSWVCLFLLPTKVWCRFVSIQHRGLLQYIPDYVIWPWWEDEDEDERCYEKPMGIHTIMATGPYSQIHFHVDWTLLVCPMISFLPVVIQRFDCNRLVKTEI